MSTNTIVAPAGHQIHHSDVKLWVACAVFLFLIISNLLNAMDRTSFPLFMPNIMKEFNFGLDFGGLLATISYLGMGIAGVVVGLFLDRTSRKLLFNTGVLIYSLATILTVYSFGFWDMFGYRVASGVGEAMEQTALLAIAAVLFARRSAVAIGILNVMFSLGAFIGPRWGGILLADHNSWRVPMLVFGIIGLLVFVGNLFMPKRVVNRRTPYTSRVAMEGGSKRVLNRNMVLIIIATALGGFISFGYLGMYGTYARVALGFSAPSAGALIGFYGLGGFVALVGGFYADRFDPRLVLSSSFGLMALASLFIFFGSKDFESQAIWSFVLGAAFSGIMFISGASYMVKSVTDKFAGLASGIFIASLYIPAAFSGFTFAAAARALGWNLGGATQLVGAAILAGLVCLFIRPRELGRAIVITDDQGAVVPDASPAAS